VPVRSLGSQTVAGECLADQRDRYSTYAELAASEVAGRDYNIRVVRRPNSEIAIIAPHGGSIEHRTSDIATAIAGDDFNLYLFEGLDEQGSFDTLHLTSHRFDEPRCIELITHCSVVVAVHGFSSKQQEVMLGGLDEMLKRRIAQHMALVGVDIKADGHAYPGLHKKNICNRGGRGRGIQLELSDGLRGGSDENAVIQSARSVLLSLSDEH
jgi:phage replication-related protein YjqB (UPF0714/DUF867 family)